MLTHSTVESVEARQPTWLAIFETLLSIAIYAFIAWRYETYLHLVVALIFAPLFLLRTKQSTQWVQSVYLRVGDQLNRVVDSIKEDQPIRFTAIAFASACYVVLVALMSRLVSTFYWFIIHPVKCIKEIPANWFQQTFCVDIWFIPELIPGENYLDLQNPDAEFHLLKSLWRNISAGFDKSNYFGYIVALFTLSPPIIFSYGISFFYRVSFKATSVVYFPIVWVSGFGLNDSRPTYERLSRFTEGKLEESRRALSWALFPVVVVVLILKWLDSDIKAVAEKLAEDSWVKFLMPWIEQITNHWFWGLWVMVIGFEIVLTQGLHYYADEAVARKDGSKPWPESRVEAIASALITLRSTIAVLLVCSAAVFTLSSYVKTL